MDEAAPQSSRAASVPPSSSGASRRLPGGTPNRVAVPSAPRRARSSLGSRPVTGVRPPAATDQGGRQLGFSGPGAVDRLLQSILSAQNGRESSSYSKALKEISAGRKRSHWIWYVWPCLREIRPTTSKPHYLLPDMDAVKAYLQHDVLAARLKEITSVAISQLQTGIKPAQLLGSMNDAEKFRETMTFFAVAAADTGDVQVLELCVEALQLCNNGMLDPRTMAAVVGPYGQRKYESVTKVEHLLTMV
eukprot:TRINITY_DN19765_c0_g1_i1.p1 TRINITY_DN19765_c0_g1~~TRINITY_DN19765_c0_g1_i1.p1  ORF type:complete len:269 (-),score=31.58 TRINITY_DN19765_c0_g1_i1:69-809(-)